MTIQFFFLALFVTAHAAAQPSAAPSAVPTTAASSASTFIFGAVIPLTGGQNATEGLNMKLGYELWARDINANGGIELLARDKTTPLLGPNGKPLRFAVDLQLRDDTSNSETYKNVLTEWVSSPTEAPDFLLGGHTSTGEVGAPIASNSSRLLMLCCTGPPSVYANGNEYLFGIHTSSDLYAEQMLKSAALSDQVKKVAIVYNTDIGFTNSTCNAAKKYAEQYNLTISVEATYSKTSANDTAMFAQFAEDIKGNGTEIVVGCTLIEDGIILAEALEAAKFPSKGTFITVIPTEKGTSVDKLGDAAKYLMSAVQWHPSMGGRVSSEQYSDNFWGTGKDYAAKFANYSKEANGTVMQASYLSASPSAAAYAVQLAIQYAFWDCTFNEGADNAKKLLFDDSTLDCDDGINEGYQRVLNSLRILRENTFFGPVAFDQNQRNVGRLPGTTQILEIENPDFATFDFGRNLSLQLVLPSDASDAQIKLPQPNRFPEICGPGTEANSTDDFMPCTPCEPGQFSETEDVCERCGRGYYSAQAGAATCTQCPKNSFTDALGSTSIKACKCLPGYFARAKEFDCQPCPRGAECPGDNARPLPRAGYWVDIKNMTEFGEVYRCNPTSQCLGGASADCQKRYGGTLCSDCAAGYFSVFGSCAACQSDAVIVLIIILVLALWFLINFIIFKRVGLLDLMVNFFQLLSVTGQMNLNWPVQLENLFGIAKIFAFEVDIVSPSCLKPSWSYLDNMVVQLCLPIAFAGVHFAAYGIQVFLSRRRQNSSKDDSMPQEAHDDSEANNEAIDNATATIKNPSDESVESIEKSYRQLAFDHAIAASMSLIAISYVAIAQYAFGAFECMDVSGTSVLVADPNVICGSSEYKAIVTLGILAVVFYIVGTPIVFTFELFRRRENMENLRNVSRWGWLYEGYTVGHWWHFLTEFLHRAVFIACITFIREPAIQALSVSFYTLAVAIWTIHTKPYVVAEYNIAAVTLLSSLIAVSVSGLVFYNDAIVEDSPELSDALEIVLIAVISFCCFIAAAAIPREVWHVLQRARAKKFANKVTQQHGKDPPADPLYDTFGSSYMRRLLFTGDAACREAGAIALSNLSAHMAHDVSPQSATSYLSVKESAIFWRRILDAFPEVIDFLAMTDRDQHLSFVGTMEDLFGEFKAARDGQRHLMKVIAQDKRASVAEWLARASTSELKQFNTAVDKMLGIAAIQRAKSHHISRQTTAARYADDLAERQLADPSVEDEVEVLKGPFVRRPSRRLCDDFVDAGQNI